MPLYCDWADTPAYKMLRPIWDGIDTPGDGTSVWDTEDWKRQPPIVRMLDELAHGPGFMGPPFPHVLMLTGTPAVTDDNVAEVYGRMRAFEDFVERPILSSVGTYDEDTGIYTPPQVFGEGTHLSPWMLSMFIGYSTNHSRRTRTEWVKWMRMQPEAERFTAKYVNSVVDTHKDEYVQWAAKHAEKALAAA